MRDKYKPFYTRPGVVGLILLIAASVFGCIEMLGRSAKARLDKRLSGYKRNGEPVTVFCLRSYFPVVPAAENSARHFYVALMERGTYLQSAAYRRERQSVPLLDNQVKFPESLTDVNIVRAQEYLDLHCQWVDVLNKISRCAGCSPQTYLGCRYYAEIRKPLGSVLAHGVDTFCLVAITAAASGRADDVHAAMRAARRLNRQLLSEPFIHNVVMAMCGERRIIETMRWIAMDGVPGMHDPALWAEFIVGFDAKYLQQAYRLERLAALDFYYFLHSKESGRQGYSLSYLKSFPDYLACRKVEQYLDYVDGCIASFGLPIENQLDAADRLESRRAKLSLGGNALMALAPSVGSVTLFNLRCRRAAEELAVMAAQPVETELVRRP